MSLFKLFSLFWIPFSQPTCMSNLIFELQTIPILMAPSDHFICFWCHGLPGRLHLRWFSTPPGHLISLVQLQDSRWPHSRVAPQRDAAIWSSLSSAFSSSLVFPPGHISNLKASLCMGCPAVLRLLYMLTQDNKRVKTEIKSQDLLRTSHGLVTR